MKKLTAVISAAAIAATMVVPITASAADTLGYNQYKAYSISGDSSKVGDATKYTMEFDITTGKNTCDNFYVRFQETNTKYVNAIDIYQYNNDGRVRYNYWYKSSTEKGGPTNVKGLIPTGVGDLLYLDESQTYHFTLNVDGKNITANITGKFANSTMTCPILEMTIPDSINPIQIIIRDTQAETNNTGITVDNVTFTVPAEEETPATAETKKVDAVLNGESVQIGNTTVTNTASDNIVVDGKYITFYKTTVTAGTNNVTGVKIKPKDYKDSAKQVNVNAEAGKTDSFYSAVISAVVTNLSADEWTYEFE